MTLSLSYIKCTYPERILIYFEYFSAIKIA